MDHQSLILGELRGFKDETIRRFDKSEAAALRLEKKVESIQYFKAKVMGMAMLSGSIAAFLATVAIEIWRR